MRQKNQIAGKSDEFRVYNQLGFDVKSSFGQNKENHCNLAMTVQKNGV